MSGQADQRYGFPRSHRLRSGRDFTRVFDARVRKNAGVMAVWGRPNELAHCRLGLAVSRKVGGSVVRSRLKRMIREAFRLTRHELPGGYDIVVVGWPHEPLTLAEYRHRLVEAVGKLDAEWQRRRRRDGAGHGD